MHAYYYSNEINGDHMPHRYNVEAQYFQDPVQSRQLEQRGLHLMSLDLLAVFSSLQLKQAVSENRSLSLQCRRRVNVAVVLSTLLYGAETWTTKAPDLQHLNLFHHQCVRSIVGVSRRQQWETNATSSALLICSALHPLASVSNANTLSPAQARDFCREFRESVKWQDELP